MAVPTDTEAMTPQARAARARQLRKNVGGSVAILAIGLVLYFLPVPAGVDPRGMHMLGIFVATILFLILQPLPTAAVAIIGLTVAMVTGTMAPGTEAFTGFGSSSIWLIIAAFFIAQGFVKTGLGRRIALLFLSWLGNSSLGVSYGLAATDLVLAPATPSNTARLGGILFPVITSISEVADSTPASEPSRKRLGAFLTATANNVNAVTSAMFMTAMAGGPVAVALAADQDSNISWGTWALAGLVPGIIALILVPLICYRLVPPTLKKMPGGSESARNELHQLGAMKRGEVIMLVTFIAMLLLWSLGSLIHINSTTVAFLGVSVLLLTRVLAWGDLAANKGAWNTLMFFAILVGMAGQLNTLGVIKWLGDTIAGVVGDLPWVWVLIILSAVYMVLHYLFASELAQIVALYALFVSVMVGAGVPAMVAALMLGAISALMGAMTHYASGPAALIFGSGYLKTSEFFRAGAVVAVVTLIIWILAALSWWQVIGLV